MAYMSQEKKAVIAAKVKPILSKHGVKGSLSVRHHSTLVLTLQSGRIDFRADYKEPDNWHYQVNTHWYHEHYRGKALAFFSEVMPLLNEGNHDRSDIMTDYFDVGWYVNVNIGKWDKPYTITP
jgi:hypothetical protein